MATEPLAPQSGDEFTNLLTRVRGGDDLAAARSQLRPEFRCVFVMFHEHGQPYEEIAAALRRPVGTIKTWLHRARLEVLERLRQRGMVPPDLGPDSLSPSEDAPERKGK